MMSILLFSVKVCSTDLVHPCRRTFTQTQLPRGGGMADAGDCSQPDCSVNLNVSTKRDKAGGDNKLVRTDR